MAKAGLLGRLAAAAYNVTRGWSPRARVVHTYHGHVLEGYFSPTVTTMFITMERWLARASDALVAISPAIRRELADTYRIGRERAVPRRPARVRSCRHLPRSTTRIAPARGAR